MKHFDFMSHGMEEVRIVYPADSHKGEDFLAHELQYALFKIADGKVIVPICHESAGEDAYEFIIGGDSPVPGHYTVDTEGHKVRIRATDLFGYMDAARYFITMKFNADWKDVDGIVPNDWHKVRLIFQNYFEEKTADLRIIFQNVWGMDSPTVANRASYVYEYHSAFHADVACLNEYYTDYIKEQKVSKLFCANGYAEVPVKKAPDLFQGNVEPMFYRTDTLRLLDSSYVDFDCHDVSKGATYAVFEEVKRPGKCFMAVCAHLSSAFDCPQAEKYLRQLTTMKFLLPEIDRLCQKWGEIPVFIGGDLNCHCSTETYYNFKRAGYQDAHDIADYKNDRCSCHGYPTYCKELNSFVTGTLPNEAPYSVGIDHLMVKNAEKAFLATYRTMQESVVPVISDHCPQMLDFSLK